MIVDCAIYMDGHRRDGQAPLHEAYDACDQEGALVWIGLYQPTPEEFDSIQREFNLHELAVEDAIKAHQRPKIEVYGDTLFIVLKTARYLDPEEVVDIGEILIFLGQSFVITVRHGQASDLHPVREELERDPERLRRGTRSVLHAILDRVVDDYQPAVANLEVDIQRVEAEVFSASRSNPAERIYKLRREVLEFHRAVVPLIEPVERLARGDYGLIDSRLSAYFRDVYDHLIRLHHNLDGLRDLLTGVLEANLTQVSVRQNEDVRRISAWVAIVAVPTMIAGVYGMNFEHMPELGWSFGYPLAIALMVGICSFLYWRFKRAGWL